MNIAHLLCSHQPAPARGNAGIAAKEAANMTTVYMDIKPEEAAQISRPIPCEHVDRVELDTPDSSWTYLPRGSEYNPDAHGGVSVVVECRACGARRLENHNCGSIERGVWGLSAKRRRELKSLRGERARVAARRAAQRRADAQAAAWRAAGWCVVSADDPCSVVVRRGHDGDEHTTTLAALDAGAAQADDGDGLVPLYRALAASARAQMPRVWVPVMGA